MRSKILLFISSFLYLMASSLNAQLISVQSSVSSDSLMIGDQVVYTLHVEAADHVDFLLPQLTDTLSRNLEVLYPLSADTTTAEGRREVNHRYMITSFEPGMQMVPTQGVIYMTGGVSDTALSMPLAGLPFEATTNRPCQVAKAFKMGFGLKPIVPASLLACWAE